MHTTWSKFPRRASRQPHPLVLRLDRSGARSGTVVLAMLLSVAILSVLATTSALSRHHASEIAALTRP